MTDRNPIYKAPESDLGTNENRHLSIKRKYATTLVLSFFIWSIFIIVAETAENAFESLLAGLMMALVGSLSVVVIPSNRKLIYMPFSLVLQIICALFLGYLLS